MYTKKFQDDLCKHFFSYLEPFALEGLGTVLAPPLLLPASLVFYESSQYLTRLKIEQKFSTQNCLDFGSFFRKGDRTASCPWEWLHSFLCLLFLAVDFRPVTNLIGLGRFMGGPFSDIFRSDAPEARKTQKNCKPETEIAKKYYFRKC